MRLLTFNDIINEAPTRYILPVKSMIKNALRHVSYSKNGLKNFGHTKSPFIRATVALNTKEFSLLLR